MVTGPDESVPNGKENQPSPAGDANTKPSRIDKGKKRKGKEQPTDEYPTGQDFEALLVCSKFIYMRSSLWRPPYLAITDDSCPDAARILDLPLSRRQALCGDGAW